MSHEHGPPSVPMSTVKWLIRGLWATLLVVVLIDGVYFGPSWIQSLGQDEHAQDEHAPAEHSEGEEPTSAPEHASAEAAPPPALGGHKHGHYWYEAISGFHALYGFIGSVLLILASKVLRRVVMRDPDFYGDDDPWSGPEEESDHA